MVSQIISKLIVLFMLICIYNFASAIGSKSKKPALIWGGLFVIVCLGLYVLYLIGNK